MSGATFCIRKASSRFRNSAKRGSLSSLMDRMKSMCSRWLLNPAARLSQFSSPPRREGFRIGAPANEEGRNPVGNVLPFLGVRSTYPGRLLLSDPRPYRSQLPRAGRSSRGTPVLSIDIAVMWSSFSWWRE